MGYHMGKLVAETYMGDRKFSLENMINNYVFP